MRISIVIPTRNRRDSLNRLLASISLQTLKPDTVVVVDSSDVSLMPQDLTFPGSLAIIRSARKSAAHQRNLGIEYLKSRTESPAYVFFLDDDVEIPVNYVECLMKIFESDYAICGASGLAKSPIGNSQAKQRISKFFVQRYRPGQLTKSLINVSPEGLLKISEVDWLIGCSAWKSYVFDYTSFEDDFVGQSLFEDVIFSYRASRLGKLVVNPALTFIHHFDSEGRPNLVEHYRSWIINRVRIFRYSSSEFSRISFVVVIFLTLLKNLNPVVFGRDQSMDKLKGMLMGLYELRP